VAAPQQELAPSTADVWRRVAIRWLNTGEDCVLAGVAVILLIAGLIVVIDAVHDVLAALAAANIATAIVEVAENALLALILAELVHTLLVSLGGGTLTIEPFLVVGVVALVRKLLLATVFASHSGTATEPLSPASVELLVLGALILALGGLVALLRAVQRRR
jgi:uncharacterized membrane protein (DUF373 family)